MMFNTHYIIELLTPKLNKIENIEANLDEFKKRYQKILSYNSIVSLPDNPMGNLRANAIETIDFLNLKTDPEKIILHLNTYHKKEDLDNFLENAFKKDLKYLLVVTGDGNPWLPKLDPKEIGINTNTVTSIELLKYIKKNYTDNFTLGVVFNQYEPINHEITKLEKKIDAGAEFVITQPVIGGNSSLDLLYEHDLPIILGAWMSKNIDLLYKCIGKEREDQEYDPVENLKKLHELYPESTIFLSLLPFNQDWEKILPKFK